MEKAISAELFAGGQCAPASQVEASIKRKPEMHDGRWMQGDNGGTLERKIDCGSVWTRNRFTTCIWFAQTLAAAILARVCFVSLVVVDFETRAQVLGTSSQRCPPSGPRIC